MVAASQLLESRRARIGRWLAAAIIVCALHAGGVALALMHWQDDEADDDAAGTLTVEMSPLPAAVPVDSPDVARGPKEQDEATPTPEASKKVEEKVEKDLPVVKPSPAPDPEIVLPKPQPEPKEQPKEEEAKEATREPEKPQQQSDPMTTAPPRVEAPPAPASSPSEGDKAVLARAQVSWVNEVMRQINRLKRVPDAARGRRGRWAAVVAFTLDPDGQVAETHIAQSSGIPALDAEAQALIRRVRFPPPPVASGDPVLYSLQIQFTVK
jgi:protein TonB